MVVQNKGLDFEMLLNGNKIILLKLSQGLIGVENSFLLGSLILSKIHQAIFRRQQQTKRNPIFIYLDEFQNFITPSIKEMLSGIRKYNVGLTLSHQDLQQLQREDSELLNSVLGNINTRIVFRIGEPDAKKLQDGFSSFDYSDLQNLSRGEAIIRIEQPQFDCSLDTIPLTLITDEQRELNSHYVINNTREHYASLRSEVEEMLNKTLNIDTAKEETHPAEQKEKPSYQEISQEKQAEKPITIQQKQPTPTIPIELLKVEEKKKDTEISTHRYLQSLIKKMAESKGYTAVLEKQLPGSNGNVDVLLSRENKTIAIEICVTTDADWEMHNINKCLEANYDEIISVSGELKQLDKIKKKCLEEIPNFTNKPVQFLTPDALFTYLDNNITAPIQNEQIIKGYRVNVTYDSISKEDMERKRASVAKVVMNSIRRQNKKQ